MYNYDVVYVKDKDIVSRVGSWLKSRDYDAILLSHPSSVGILYTCIDTRTGESSVVTVREVARRFKVVRADSQAFTEEVPRSILNINITNKLEYLESVSCPK